jgi:hypothetical protein
MGLWVSIIGVLAGPGIRVVGLFFETKGLVRVDCVGWQGAVVGVANRTGISAGCGVLSAGAVQTAFGEAECATNECVGADVTAADQGARHIGCLTGGQPGHRALDKP